MLIIAIVFALTAQVQTPRAKQQQPPKESQQDNSATTKAVESIAADLHAINQRQAKDETQRAKQEPQTWRDGFTPATWSNWFLVVFAILATVVGIRTLGQLKRQTTAAITAASAAKTSADAVMLAERAYISISHHPPGITIDEFVVTRAGEESFGGWHDVTLKFGVTNNGNTPAKITDICLYNVVDSPASLPPQPTGPGNGEHLFLVKGDAAHDTRTFHLKGRDRNQLGLTMRLWVLGYVDYIDAFEIRRRAGYARFYDPDIDSRITYEDSHSMVDEERFRKRNNLPFVTEPDYNYDRQREPGEGNDWPRQGKS